MSSRPRVNRRFIGGVEVLMRGAMRVGVTGSGLRAMRDWDSLRVDRPVGRASVDLGRVDGARMRGAGQTGANGAARNVAVRGSAACNIVIYRESLKDLDE